MKRKRKRGSSVRNRTRDLLRAGPRYIVTTAPNLTPQVAQIYVTREGCTVITYHRWRDTDASSTKVNPFKFRAYRYSVQTELPNPYENAVRRLAVQSSLWTEQKMIRFRVKAWEGGTWVNFCWFVPLASQISYPIIVCSVANSGPHLS